MTGAGDLALCLAGAAALGLAAAAVAAHARAGGARARVALTGAGWACLVAALILLDLSVPRLVSSYVWQIVIKAGIYITLAVSLNVINGIAGQFSMGHAGFMAVGAYAAVWLTMRLGERAEGWAWWFPWNGPWCAAAGAPGLAALPWGLGQGLVFLCALLAGGAAAALAGYVVGIPSLRLRGDYLAIVTLGFGEIIRNLIANVDSVGASRGLPGVPHLTSLFWVLLFAAISIYVSYRLLASGPGRAMLAVREDEIAAAAVGIDTTRAKMQAFAIGTFFAGVAGGLLAHHFEYLHPDYFKFDKSFEVIIMVVLGGMGSVSGAAVAAVILALAPELLRSGKDLLGSLTEPAVLYAAGPFILFAAVGLALAGADLLALIGRGSARLVGALRARARGATEPADFIARRRSGPRAFVRIPVDAVARSPRLARAAGLGALAGLGAAILHRGIPGSSIGPRTEYWLCVLAGAAVGAGLEAWRGRGNGRQPSRGAWSGSTEGRGAGPGAGAKDLGDGRRRDGRPPSRALCRLAALGLMSPIAFSLAYALERGAPGALARLSVFFREFPDPRMVLYSILLIALMLTRPTGLFGSAEIWTWWRERRAVRAGDRR